MGLILVRKSFSYFNFYSIDLVKLKLFNFLENDSCIFLTKKVVEKTGVTRQQSHSLRVVVELLKPSGSLDPMKFAKFSVEHCSPLY